METNEVLTIPKEERTWAMITHLSVLSGFFIPFGNIIAPLVLWLIRKDTMPFVDEQGKEALNFQISITIYAIASALLILLAIGIILLPVVLILDFIFIIVAVVKSNEGVHYKYPLSIRLIK